MSYKTCPEWPELMELAPDLQFKHISVADAQLPFDVLSKISHVSLGEVEMCADLEHNVFNGAHTDPQVVAALAGTHWFEVHEWATTGPGRLESRRLATLPDARLTPWAARRLSEWQRSSSPSARAARAGSRPRSASRSRSRCSATCSRRRWRTAARVRLVTDDAAALRRGGPRRRGRSPIPGGGQGAAVEAALAGVDGACLVVNADLPVRDHRQRSAALAALAPRARRRGGRDDERARAPDRRLVRARSTARAAPPASRPRGLVPGSRSPSSSTTSTRSPTSSARAARLPLGRRTDLVLNQHKVLAARTA